MSDIGRTARRLQNADWLTHSSLTRLLGILSSDGEEARVAGGAVRNALMGLPPGDIDVATTALPDEVTGVSLWLVSRPYRPASSTAPSPSLLPARHSK